MIRACPGPAAPFIRVPDATEGDIQKAVDIGALGVIVPMVDTVEKVEKAVTFAMYPPLGKRSQGGGQYGRLWGRDYRQQANDNIMIVAMIENPEGVEIVDEIAALEHVDAVFAASSDLSSFTGLRQGDPDYEAISRMRAQVPGPPVSVERDARRLYVLPGPSGDVADPNGRPASARRRPGPRPPPRSRTHRGNRGVGACLPR